MNVQHKPHKPLHVNPIAHSQPMGATLAYLGVKDCLPLMHGAQGCASFTKVLFTRHFSEPIAIQNTAVSDITAVLDGGDYSILTAIENVTKKVKPSLIGLHTTGLTETKGDDIRGAVSRTDYPTVFVNTPDYEGGLESGWALTAKALIEQLTDVATVADSKKLLLLPNVSMQPIEVERLKEFCEGFGLEVYALPDISTSLDGHLCEGQGKLAGGGITVEEIKQLGRCGNVITIGASMKIAAEALLEKNPKIKHHHFDHVMGLDKTDELVALLMELRHIQPLPSVKRWRQRLQDAMLDTHFTIGGARMIVTGEPDQLAGLCALLNSAGAKILAAIATNESKVLETIQAEKVFVGDLEDAEALMDNADILIGNFHVERIANRHHKGYMHRGFPNYEEVGNQLKNDSLYEGSAYLLFETANIITKATHHG